MRLWLLAEDREPRESSAIVNEDSSVTKPQVKAPGIPPESWALVVKPLLGDARGIRVEPRMDSAPMLQVGRKGIQTIFLNSLITSDLPVQTASTVVGRRAVLRHRP